MDTKTISFSTIGFNLECARAAPDVIEFTEKLNDMNETFNMKIKLDNGTKKI